MRPIHQSAPFADMTVAQCEIAGCVVEFFQRTSLRAPFDGPRPQHHRESLIMAHPAPRLHNGCRSYEVDSHSLGPLRVSPPAQGASEVWKLDELEHSALQISGKDSLSNRLQAGNTVAL